MQPLSLPLGMPPLTEQGAVQCALKQGGGPHGCAGGWAEAVAVTGSP